MHGCLDCFAQGSCGLTGPRRLARWGNGLPAGSLVSRLRAELARRRPRPPAVCLDFASDPFQPVPELLEQTYQVIQCLVGEGVGVVFQTRAKIPRRHIELLLALARAGAGDYRPADTRSPLAADLRAADGDAAGPAGGRWEQLVAGGVATLARVDPILPGLSDDPDALHALCAALAAAGVRELAAGVLVLRPARRAPCGAGWGGRSSFTG